MSKNKIKISLVLIVAVAIFGIVYLFLGYPNQWKTIQIGDTREYVINKIGNSTDSTIIDVKGEFWMSENSISKHQLMLTYDTKNKVSYKRLIVWSKFNPDYLSWTIVNEFKQ